MTDKNSEEVVGFASYNANYLGSWGPTGMKKELRGKGLGGLLLKATLIEMKKQGLKRAQIEWVVGNTIKFYSKVVGAYIGEIYYPMKAKIRF